MTDRRHSRAELIVAFVLGTLLSPGNLEAKPGGAALSLESCRISDADGLVTVAARCGRLAVAENPAEPDGRKIELAIAVVPAVATQPKPDPLFLLAGGPGQGAIEAYAPLLDAYSGIRRERDLVLVDQRGTGGSNRLDCRLPEEALATGELSPMEMRELARDCLAKLPGRPQFYTTSIAVRDLDAVRAALGYERVNLLGGSYGTRVAQHYARRFPKRTRTIVLDSVVPPTLALVPQIAIESERALERVFARCAKDPVCDGRFPALAAQFERLDARLSRGPVTIRMADPVGGGLRDIAVRRAHLVIMARMLTYSARSASLMPLVIHEAATHDNLVPLTAQGEMVGKDLERLIAIGMHHSVVCAEDAPRFAGAVDREELERTTIGPVMLDGMTAICGIWPRGPVDADFHDPLNSKVPALVLSGEFDPATPSSYGALAATGFENHLHVVVPGQGHGQSQIPCVQRLLRRFIERGTAEGIDTACIDTIRPAPFFLTFSGSAP
ncbi:MAG: alpha/beta hydrolase [Steroidobacteraceae bacterium]